MSSATLMDQLREATRAAHGGLESLPYLIFVRRFS